MFNTNLVYSCQNHIWKLPIWDYLVNEVSNVYKLTPEEKKQLENSYTAKIIATIPFEAECKNPERTAIAHLCLYVAELKGFQKYCSHLPTDDNDIFNRLAFISTFESGKQEIINHGMNVLALIMLEGYKRSIEKDRINNVYNPLISGKWNYQSIKNKLLWEINKINVPNIDWIFTNIPLNIW
ncbi:MAG: hypothetical protein IJ688_01825 [Treponema sp.]|nr:hypothetical protein [Treponema sp.]